MDEGGSLMVQWLNLVYCPSSKCITATISRDWRLDSEANRNVKNNFIVKRKIEKGRDEVRNFNKTKCHFYWISGLLSTFHEWELLTKSWIYIWLWRWVLLSSQRWLLALEMVIILQFPQQTYSTCSWEKDLPENINSLSWTPNIASAAMFYLNWSDCLKTAREKHADDKNNDYCLNVTQQYTSRDKMQNQLDIYNTVTL